MERGNLHDTPALDLLVRVAREGATGCLRLQDGRIRRDFFLRDGRLVASRSNLKSEALATLRERHPGAGADDLAALQAARRVAGALKMRGEWAFEDGAAPPAERPADLLAALWRALCEQEDVAALRGLLPGGWPDLVDPGPLSALPLPEGLRAELELLDGGRPLDDVLAFTAAGPLALLAALVLGERLGAIAIREAPAATQVASTGRDLPTDPGLAEQAAHPARQEDPPGKGGGGEAALAPLRSVLREMEEAANHFEVLGVAWDAPEDALRRRYFELARTWHPDAFEHEDPRAREIAEAIFAKIAEAWETLGDAERRAAYVDRVVHGRKTEEELAMEKVQAILDAEHRFKQALRDFQAGRVVQAAEGFRACVEAVPEENEFQAYLGYCEWRIHRERDPDLAARGEDRLKEAVDSQPRMVSGWVLLGRLYGERGMPDLAQRCLVRALKLNPADPDAQREMRRLKGRRANGGKGGDKAGRTPFWKKLFGKGGG